ncbi:protein NSP-INTERACTING KINASE 3-like [Zea mays]|uniref:protein NSP-INTERACTING KINASE 3-like n=1 Tax=Zea mays TaxID=4577 RepID=UPI0009AA6674|nr:protein NSP-INTERACTING KINASE 3-like [Zea mays]|eukprot:XP_020402313.1 protein NSP-INTERACTING KINASE 3-like [Zea mays]
MAKLVGRNRKVKKRLRRWTKAWVATRTWLSQYHLSHWPRMSEVIRMLEGDRLTERWEVSQNVDTPEFVSSELLLQKYMDFAADECSLGVEAMELSGLR